MFKGISSVFRHLRPSKNLSKGLFNEISLLSSQSTLGLLGTKSLNNNFIPKYYYSADAATIKQAKPKPPVDLQKFKESLTERVLKEYNNRKNFSASIFAINKMIFDLKNQNYQPNFYDCLMMLVLAYQSSVHDPLVTSLPSDISNAHRILKEWIANPESHPELNTDLNIDKLLLFLCEFSFKQFNQTPKQFSNFFQKMVVKPSFTPLQGLDIFTNKLGYINKSLYHRRDRNKVLDILRAVLILTERRQVFKDLPVEIEKNNFQLPDEAEKLLFKTINIVNHVLNEEDTADIVPVCDSFLNRLTQLSYIAKFSIRMASSLLETPHFIAERTNQPLTKYGELILFCNEMLIENMKTLTLEKFTRVLFMNSRLTIFNINYNVYARFLEAALAYIIENLNKFTPEQLKSNLYGIGLHGLNSPEIQSMYNQLTEIGDIQSKMNYPKFPLYVKNLITSAANVYALQKGPKLTQLLKFVVNDLKMHEKGSEYYDPVSFTKIATVARRLEFNDLFLWNAFFNSITDLMQNKEECGYDILFIFKTFEIFEKQGHSQKEYEGILEVLQNFRKNRQSTYEEIMSYNMKEVLEKRGHFDQYSSLNHQIGQVLENLGMKYEEEALSKFRFFKSNII